MSRIKILPPQITNLIAAGEVVERPASIVKELIENSLDAGSSRLRINIQGGGRKLVQVTDNGYGMDRDDAMMCIEPHATSKIKSEEDVENIQTLGFRGEAMPSIAAVTQFSIMTRQHDDPEGTEVIINGGKLIDVRSAGCAPGTTISAKNLFFNLPVRRKFLRTPQTESLHIQQIVQMQALAHPDKSFELIIDGKTVIKVIGNAPLKTRASMILGKEYIDGMLPVNYEESDICITGFIAKPGFTRSTRKDQIFFINKRPIISDTLYFGVRDAYHTLVMKGRYAPVLLFLDMKPVMVDINVHPQKREVRFRNNTLVGNIIAAAVRKALQDDQLIAYTTPSPVQSPAMPSLKGADAFKAVPAPISTPSPHVQKELNLASPATPTQPAKPTFLAKSTIATRTNSPATKSSDAPPALPTTPISAPPSLPSTTPTPAPAVSNLQNLPSTKETEKPKQQVPETTESEGHEMVVTSNPEVTTIPDTPIEAESPHASSEITTEEVVIVPEPEEIVCPSTQDQERVTASAASGNIFSNLRILGTLSKQYIMAEGPEGLVLLDQQAAHQRIVFEQILNENKVKEDAGQPLLIPVTLELSPRDSLLLKKNQKHFNNLGFSIDDFGGNTYIIAAVPANFPQENIVGLFHNILDDLSQSPGGIPRGNEVKLAKLAAKHAVRGSDQLKEEEIKHLLKELAATEMPYTCPNGKPTMINYAFSEIASRFGKRK